VIETANVQSEVLDGSLGTPRGAPQVMLEVRDTGVGMDAATRDRIFEPFFTTKAPGKGTGLGLSTVYGIVRQSEGTITVHTEPGQGCAIRCFFPATDEVKRQPGETAELPDVAGGTETLLVAEDEEQLRALVRRYLGTRGYTILEARDGREAIDVAQSHKGPIHLLVTDVVMPHMSGKELAKRLQQERPGLRVLFISGYSSEAIERHGELAPDSVFLQKPIQPVALARAVREILDDEPATHGRG
jgi:two-component system cell cycle sensor histidine kinase/response regulator CckA